MTVGTDLTPLRPEKVIYAIKMTAKEYSTYTGEEKHYRTGYEEGFIAGCEFGSLEGCLLGIEKGHQIGSEIGFYRGYVNQLRNIMETDANIIKPRAVKTVESLNTLLEKFPLEDVLNQTLFEELEAIRTKFKQLGGQLGVSLRYGSVDEAKGASF